MKHTAKKILSWNQIFNEKDLRMSLFTIYIFIEIGGTGGGCFRYMYSRFLKESAQITGNDELSDASEKIRKSGEMFTEIANLFINAEVADDLNDRIKKASQLFQEIASAEEKVFNELIKICQ